MQDLKIGETVQPATPIRQKEYGTGIIIETNKSGRQSIRVLFKSEKLTFETHDFEESKLERVEVSKVMTLKLKALVIRYNDFIYEFKSV